MGVHMSKYRRREITQGKKLIFVALSSTIAFK
jgi:hypothetical protein